MYRNLVRVLIALAFIAASSSSQALAQTRLKQESGLKALIVAAVKEAVTQDFKDPVGAQFRNVLVYNIGKAGTTFQVCGEVNGRNSYGALVGFRRFYVYMSRRSGVVKIINTILNDEQGSSDVSIKGLCDTPILRQEWLM